MAAISLGLEWNPQTGAKGPRLFEHRNKHVVWVGAPGASKGVSLEMVNLLRLGDGKLGGDPLSIISIDNKGENAAVTSRFRSTISETTFLNPLNLFNLGSAGFNPLVALDPSSPQFFVHASNIAEALSPPMAGKSDPFFDISGRNLMLLLVMWETTLARIESRPPLLKHVRGYLTGDLPAIAKRIFEFGNFQMSSLAGQFMETNRTTQGIVATAAASSQWLLDPSIQIDTAKDGIDFKRLKGPTPISCYVILPAHALDTFSSWLRLVVASAFNALYRNEEGGGLHTLFLLSEFASLKRLNMVMTALAQGRGYGLQMIFVVQDLNQLAYTYSEKEMNTFLGTAGATFCFAPNDPQTSEWMSKRSGDVTKPNLSASDDPQTGARDSWRGDRRRRFYPDDLYNLPERHGLVFFQGQSEPVPVYAPAYFDKRDNPDLAGRYDPNPYYRSPRRKWFWPFG